MNNERRIILTGLGLALPLLARPAWAQFGGLSSIIGGGSSPSVSPGAFIHHVTVGTKAFLRATIAINLALERNTEANRLQAFLDSQKGDLDGNSLKQAQDEASRAAIPAGAQIKSNKAEARKHVLNAWLFGSLAGYADKLAADDAKALTATKSPDPRVAAVLPTAVSAVSVLPNHIQSAADIVFRSAQYMSSNGVQKPSAEDARKAVSAAMGADASDMIGKSFT